jgi:hypothetical protein
MNRIREPVRIASKGWGREVWIRNGDRDRYLQKGSGNSEVKSVRCIFISSNTRSVYLRAGGSRCGSQESARGSEMEEFILEAGHCMDILAGLVHQMEAPEDAELYEFSSQHFDSDSHRLGHGD